MRTLLAFLLLSLPALAQGSAYTYCQSTPNSFGNAATIGYTGSLDLNDQTFTLTVVGQPATPNSFGTHGSAAPQSRHAHAFHLPEPG
jgi:hypothetical protein